jgi:hypothetical protein
MTLASPSIDCWFVVWWSTCCVTCNSVGFVWQPCRSEGGARRVAWPVRFSAFLKLGGVSEVLHRHAALPWDVVSTQTPPS